MKWNDITIGKYIQIMQIQDGDKWDNVKAAAIAKGITFEEAKKLPISEVAKIRQEFESLDWSDIPEKPAKKWRDYKIDNLMRDINAGQMINYDELLSQCVDKTIVESGKDGAETTHKVDTTVSEDKIIANIHMFIAILTTKKGDTSNDIEERAELFYNEMPYTIAHRSNVFFCKVAKRLGHNLRSSLKEEQENPIS